MDSQGASNPLEVDIAMPPSSIAGASEPAPLAADAGPSNLASSSDAGPSNLELASSSEPGPDDDALLKAFLAEVTAVDRDNEVNRILGAFKLNPYEQLGLRNDATPEEIKKQYRKVSLLVHPDKCSHPLSSDAFKVIQSANKNLQDEDFIRELRYALDHAREEVRKERKKAVKHNAAVRVASLLHEAGRGGVEAEFESSDVFHDAWKLKARDVIARAEFRRQKMVKRLKEEEERIEDGEDQTRKKLKASREHHKKWEETREDRVGSWRDFRKNKTSKGDNKEIVLKGLRPPKQRTWDEDKTYIQRPVGEQFRPPPPKPANQPKHG